ncbi:MAG: aminoglycoside phosphotransferase family protein [Lachnospiraceae bacterium]|nr:aminoglycoside phosphotransferase family protein [Lachnospiraceae bacterium]
MTREECCSKRHEALEAFGLPGRIISCEKYGNGHINDTFLVITEKDGAEKRYILQRMNTDVFKDPEMLMRNVVLVTDFLKEKIRSRGGDVERETLNPLCISEGKAYYKDSIGSYWRVYTFITDAVSLDQVRSPQDFYESAVTFGRFSGQMASFDASLLAETIPDFHNTPKRFETFWAAVEADVCQRADSVRDEIAFFEAHKADMEYCAGELAQGLIPLRVTHNDTKLNNIMLDAKTGKGICVIDLDTVMPGLSIFDFGDSIRFGANTAAEDERDLSKVSLSLELFETYVKGYLAGSDGALTDEEIRLMPYGAKTMTLECGMRFLTDYLQGDVYFMVHRDGHNLDRAHTQIRLVEDMENKWNEMERIVARGMS